MQSETATTAFEPKKHRQIEDSIVHGMNSFWVAADAEFDAGRKLLRKTLGETKRSPFLWAVGEPESESQFLVRMDALHRRFWKAESDKEQNGTGFVTCALESQLARLALTAYGFDLEMEFESQIDDCELASRPLDSQLSFVEYPLWRIASERSEIEPVRLIIQRMERLIRDCLDGDGWPEARLAKSIGLLTASWSRCCELLKFLGRQIDPDVYFLLCELNQQLFRMKRENGSLLFAEATGGLNCNSFKKCLRRNFSDSFLDKLRKGKKALRSTRQPAASSVSEWGQIGVLQAGWKPRSSKIGIAFGQQVVHLDVCHGDSLVQGECLPQLTINDRRSNVKSEIGVSAYLKFDYGELLELEIEYEGAIVQRQILFLAAHKLLFVNDVVSTIEPAKLRYVAEYPLGDNVEIVRESETNEFYLKREDSLNLVLPLALPEWKTQIDNAKVSFNENSFEISKSKSGNGFAMPIVIDLDCKRSLRPRTWRRLTVAEGMQVVDEDAAAAFRVQIGNDQWLFYRSVSQTGNRTFLGQNYADEFFVGKIDRNGEVKSLLEIE